MGVTPKVVSDLAGGDTDGNGLTVDLQVLHAFSGGFVGECYLLGADLSADVVLPCAEEGDEMLLGLHVAEDELLHIELHGLPHLLDGPDQVPSPSFSLYLGRDGGVDE